MSARGDEAHLVPPGDVEALSDGLLKVIENRELADQLCESGSKRVSEFSMDRLATMYVDIYERAIDIERQDPHRGGWRGELSRMGWPFKLGVEGDQSL